MGFVAFRGTIEANGSSWPLISCDLGLAVFLEQFVQRFGQEFLRRHLAAERPAAFGGEVLQFPLHGLIKIAGDVGLPCPVWARRRGSTGTVNGRWLVLNFSLPPEVAVEVKIEAARRNLSLRKLFIELWALYKANKPV